ncbi:MAG: cell envelope integrity protein CreD [Dongiaceae bacterium]
MINLEFAAIQHRLAGPAGLTVRVVVLVLLTLLLLIPLSMIDDLIDERSIRRSQVESEIAAQWGGEQLVGGPMLAIPHVVRRTEIKSNGTAVDHEDRRMVYALPSRLDVNAVVKAERRYRSIYDFLVYGVEIELTGRFTLPDFREWNIDAKDVRWNEATLTVGIADMHGVRAASFLFDGRSLSLTPNLSKAQLFAAGLAGRPLESVPAASGSVHAFTVKLALNGSSSLRILPFGNDTAIKMAADWPHPNFIGANLPAAREIGDDGFTAEWALSYLARPYPPSWRAEDLNFRELPDGGVGVELILPGDSYQQTDRIVKYGVMVIGLTFATIFVVGLLKAARAHTVQYLLVGASICLFYLLVLSLSEHIRFIQAYVVASLVNMATISVYAARTIGRVSGAVVAAILAVIHGWMFVLLQMADYVLLSGSAGLFAALILMMYATRNVDWFRLGSSAHERRAPVPST